LTGRNEFASIVDKPLTADQAARAAKILKALADPVRLRLLSNIASRYPEEVCVCDVVEWFDLTQPTISHHLKVLRLAGLLDSERRSTWVYYRAVPDTLRLVATMLGGVGASSWESTLTV
jgi:ArsR family transcriptional regulator